MEEEVNKSNIWKTNPKYKFSTILKHNDVKIISDDLVKSINSSGYKFSVGKTQKDFRSTNVPQNDIQTSLNMNTGVHNIHPKNV